MSSPSLEATPPGRAACALELARAELEAKRRGWYCACETDADGWAMFGEGEYYMAVLYTPRVSWNCEDGILAVLGGIDVEHERCPDYWRVISAELAVEALGA